MWDDDTDYELSDPKHPTFHDRYADTADLARKRAKEEPPAAFRCNPDESAGLADDSCECGTC